MSVNTADMYSQLGVRQQSSLGPQRRTEMGQEDFLRLMTEQLKNQDPLKPMDQGEFIGQMAQFSTVKGIEQMNAGLNNLGYLMGESQALQAASMVGRTAYIGTDVATLEGESGVQGSLTAPAPGPVTLEVRTPGGQLVRSFVVEAGAALEAIQSGLYEEARARRDANITRGVTEWVVVADHFDKGGKYPGWVEVEWAKPTGAALDAVVEKLKALKLTIRNVPRGGDAATGACIFTGEPAVERILVARAY
jgi:hypothetical protein